jgi:hypothetical protein
MTIASRALRVLVLAAFASAAAAGVVAVQACLEVTPITVPPRDASSFLKGGCSACVSAPSAQGGCSNARDECFAEPACAAIMACIDQNDCFDGPTFTDKITCGIPCALDAGVSSYVDPRLQGLLNTVECAQKQCATVCNFGDAGLTEAGP